MKKTETEKCKHNMTPEWCAYCCGLVTSKNQHKDNAPNYMDNPLWGNSLSPSVRTETL